MCGNCQYDRIEDRGGELLRELRRRRRKGTTTRISVVSGVEVVVSVAEGSSRLASRLGLKLVFVLTSVGFHNALRLEIEKMENSECL
jgi:NAD(P)H-hydrate repair Nnr-like enzyme with NAD(P)H-hydrate dehydratase domain